MTITKKEFSAVDAATAVLYAKRDGESQIAYPVVATTSGELPISNTVLTNAVDGETTALRTVTYEHHEIHAGSHYFINDAVDLSINNVFDMQFQTPNSGKWTHLVFKLDCESETEWFVYETVTYTVTGTVTAIYNNNRNSSNTSGNIVYSILNTSLANANADTNITGSTQLMHGIIGDGKTGGDIVRDNELMLKQNTKYAFRAVATAAGYIAFAVDFYEHTSPGAGVAIAPGNPMGLLLIITYP